MFNKPLAPDLRPDSRVFCGHTKGHRDHLGLQTKFCTFSRLQRVVTFRIPAPARAPHRYLAIPGTFTAAVDILPCSLCPKGTTTNGLSGQLTCLPCETGAFCPLGAALGNVSLTSPLLKSINQARAYPLSPQSIRFDNILMQNMFVIHTGASPHCLVVSPLFWALIVTAVGVCIWIVMLVVKHHVRNARGQKIRNDIKHLIKKTDLVGEGELVAGGLASFAIIVLVAFAFTFSDAYFSTVSHRDV